MENLCEVLHGDESKQASLSSSGNLCLGCTVVILRSKDFLPCHKQEVVELLNQELRHCDNFEELLHRTPELAIAVMDSLGTAIIDMNIPSCMEKEGTYMDPFFEGICICVTLLLRLVYCTLHQDVFERCIDVLVNFLCQRQIEEIQKSEKCSSDTSQIIGFLLLFLMKNDLYKEENDFYRIVASRVLTNREAMGYLLKITCEPFPVQIRIMAGNLISLSFDVLINQDGEDKISSGKRHLQRVSEALLDNLPHGFEDILELEPDIGCVDLEEFLVSIVVSLISLGYTNFQSSVDKVVSFLQVRCLFPNVRVRLLVVEAFEGLLERVTWAGIAQYILVTGTCEYLIESIRTLQNTCQQNEQEVDFICSCFEGTFRVVSKLLKIQEAGDLLSSFTFESILQSMNHFLTQMTASCHSLSQERPRITLQCFFSFMHSFFDDGKLCSISQQSNSICAQNSVSLKFIDVLIGYLGVTGHHDALEKEVQYLLLHLIKERASFLEEQLELLQKLYHFLGLKNRIWLIAHQVLCNILQTTEEERPRNYREILCRLLLPLVATYNIRTIEDKDDAELLLQYLMTVNNFMIPSFWNVSESGLEGLVETCRIIWKTFHLRRVFSLFRECCRFVDNEMVTNVFRGFLSRLLTVLDDTHQQTFDILELSLDYEGIQKSFQSLSGATYASSKLLLQDFSICGRFAIDMKILCSCLENISKIISCDLSLKNVQLAILIADLWVAAKQQMFTENFQNDKEMKISAEMSVPGVFLKFLFTHLPRPFLESHEKLITLLQSCHNTDNEIYRTLFKNFIDVQNEDEEAMSKDSILKIERYIRVHIELACSFDEYSSLFIQDISQFIKYLRLNAAVSKPDFQIGLQFWSSTMPHFSKRTDFESVLPRLLRQGLLERMNEFFHALVEVKETETKGFVLYLASLLVKIFTNLLMELLALRHQARNCNYLDAISDILHTLIAAIDLLFVLPEELFCEILNCLHVIVIHLDRTVDNQSFIGYSSSKKSLVRNIVAKQPWFKTTIENSFMLLGKPRDYSNGSDGDSIYSYMPHWRPLFSLFSTLIAFCPKSKRESFIDYFPQRLDEWLHLLLACSACDKKQHLLTLEVNILFACVARLREYKWVCEQKIQNEEDCKLLYLLCNEMFSSNCFVEIAAYRVCESLLRSLHSHQVWTCPIDTSLDVLRCCLRLKMTESNDTSLLVMSPRLSLIACLLEFGDSWFSYSYREYLLGLLSELLAKDSIDSTLKLESILSIIKIVRHFPDNYMREHPDVFESLQDADKLSWDMERLTRFPFRFNDLVMSPVFHQWHDNITGELRDAMSKEWKVLDYQKQSNSTQK